MPQKFTNAFIGRKLLNSGHFMKRKNVLFFSKHHLFGGSVLTDFIHYLFSVLMSIEKMKTSMFTYHICGEKRLTH